MKKILSIILISFFVYGCNEDKIENDLLNLCKEGYYPHQADKAKSICSILSEQGNKEATLMLAFLYSTYFYFSKSDEEVKELLQPLLDQSNKDAKCILGFRLIGNENKEISNQGIKLLEESIGQKCDINNVWIASGKFALAQTYYDGDNVDYKKALALFKELEEEEKVDDFFGGKKFRDELQILIGFMYFMGLGTPSDNKTAYEYWQKAYQTGYEYAAIPMIEYTDLNKYLDKMLHFKKEKDKKEYINWITTGEGKKYLIKKDEEETCLPKLKKYATAEGIYIYATSYNLNNDEDDYCGC